MFTIRGAYSIDKHIRKEGVDYFPNEELDYNQINKAIDLYKEKKPKIVVSHDCPQSARENLFSITDKSITSNGLERLLEEHEPDLWIFGHHHKSVNTMIGNTNFVCLDELETYEI